jgi:hypothetical protein
MKHPAELFKLMVATLNRQFQGRMTFELVGSLEWKSASEHDADILVHTLFPIHLSALAAGFNGGRIVAVDRNSTMPFPGRPDGQDRVRVAWEPGLAIDLFFAKGVLAA